MLNRIPVFAAALYVVFIVGMMIGAPGNTLLSGPDHAIVTEQTQYPG